MKGSTFFITLMIALGVMIVFFTFYADLENNYGIIREGNYTPFEESIKEYSNELYDVSLNQSEYVQKAEALSVSQVGYEILTQGMWNAVKMPFYAVKIIYNMLTTIYWILGIPEWLGNIILAILTMVITYIILRAVFRIDM